VTDFFIYRLSREKGNLKFKSQHIILPSDHNTSPIHYSTSERKLGKKQKGNFGMTGSHGLHEENNVVTMRPTLLTFFFPFRDILKVTLQVSKLY